MLLGSLFLNGLVVGFSIAAPVGPIGVLCIRRSLADGVLKGLASGLGAATADAAYGCVAAFGLTAVSGFLVRQQLALGLIGGVFLCYLGVRTFVARPAADSGSPGGGSLLSAYGSTVLLTLANPLTILSFAAVFAGLGLGRASEYASAGSMVLGVFLGSSLWWLILSGGVGMLRSRVKDGWMRAINRVSGTVLFAFGLYALSRA
ncbi:MAG TPA: LysE family transporter [Opitutaceae bacterium]|nr:LysE family transporter [Opitutaceae bacterium]